MLDRFPPKRNFHSLSVRQLLEARDAFHSHLLHLANVVGTGIGLYRIRQEEVDADDPEASDARVQARQRGEYKSPGPRTLANSVTRSWSWPCVLVFVNEWKTEEAFRDHPDEMVPRFLYARDDLVVPTCVVLVEPEDVIDPPRTMLDAPVHVLGGGHPLMARVQGRLQVGSVGCLVRDARNLYALTNQHVAGDPGCPVEGILCGERTEIGKSHAKQVGKIPFTAAYPGFPGTETLSTLDAGLVEVRDVNEWTAQIYGLGELGDVVDLNTTTFSLDLIGTPVEAFGAASTLLKGEIAALFYRYRSIGGLDYIADMLIGPPPGGELATRRGDSGTLWVWDAGKANDAPDNHTVRVVRPIAMQWGGQAFVDAGSSQRFRFALATALSSICRQLDVEVVRDLNTGQLAYWGKVGHFKIGFAACSLLVDADLSKLMLANAERIGVSDVDIVAEVEDDIKAPQFVPLADVADLVWRSSRGKDKANHFADMDQKGKAPFKGKTLMDLFDDDPSTLNATTWTEFYDSLDVTKDAHRGALPIRMREFYEAMVEFAANAEIPKFVCAAGLAAHYIGDACQPLHVSHLHHGENASDELVHSQYETTMIGRFRDEVTTDVRTKAKKIKKSHCFTGGEKAAQHLVKLMRNTLAHLPPDEVLEVWRDSKGSTKYQDMWDALGGRTTDVMARGAEALAVFWESAWREGRGRAGAKAVKKSQLVMISKSKLMALYNNKQFLESRWLREMAADD